MFGGEIHAAMTRAQGRQHRSGGLRLAGHGPDRAGASSGGSGSHARPAPPSADPGASGSSTAWPIVTRRARRRRRGAGGSWRRAGTASSSSPWAPATCLAGALGELRSARRADPRRSSPAAPSAPSMLFDTYGFEGSERDLREQRRGLRARSCPPRRPGSPCSAAWAPDLTATASRVRWRRGTRRSRLHLPCTMRHPDDYSAAWRSRLRPGARRLRQRRRVQAAVSCNQLPLIPGASVIDPGARSATPGANAFCAIEAVIVDRRASSSGALMESEHRQLHSLGWTTQRGRRWRRGGRRLARAQAPRHLRHRARRPDRAGREVDQAALADRAGARPERCSTRTPAMSIMLEVGPT